MKVTIYPLEKITLGTLSIAFGMPLASVEAVIGRGQIVRNRHFYFNNELAIDYDADHRVEYIEFLGGIDGDLQPVIFDCSVFDADADALAEVLRQKNGDEMTDVDGGYTLSFHQLSIGLYRETRPSDVLEMMEEMKALGIPTEDNEDVAEEMRRASHWAAIGAGISGYYQ